MRLLIVTQAVDLDEPVLGFFHRWIEELAGRYEQIHVVCLAEGRHSLPANVSVHSLGKERGVSKLTYVLNFYRHVWHLRHDYDTVFVHMNQEYVLLAGFLWKLLGKNVYLWRNHYSGNALTALAVALADKVFCTSTSSYTAKFRKTVIMPVGVGIHRPAEAKRVPHSILFLARIAPSKYPNILLKALKQLHERGVKFSASLFGSPLAKDVGFADELRAYVEKEHIPGVTFHAGVPNHETPAIYSTHDVFVNLSASGMYDKTLFEAAAAGCLVLASSRDFAETVDRKFIFAEKDAEDLAHVLETVLGLSEVEKDAARHVFTALAEQHSLKNLGKRLFEEMD